MHQRHLTQIHRSDGLCLGAQSHDLANNFMTQGQRRLDPTFGQREFFPAAHVVMALPEVQVGVTDASGFDFEQDLCPLGFGGGFFNQRQVLSVVKYAFDVLVVM